MNYDDSAKKQELSPPPAAPKAMANPTDPGVVTGREKDVPLPDAYSVQPADMQNRVAQADGVAAHHVEANQNASSSRSKSKKGTDPHVAKIVQEENESRSKFPKYPGLERWQLLEKMGDGAFSNVYRAADREGNAGEVAIKVVRKFEMNNMQVSVLSPLASAYLRPILSFSAMASFPFCFLYQRGGGAIGPETSTSGFQGAESS